MTDFLLGKFEVQSNSDAVITSSKSITPSSTIAFPTSFFALESGVCKKMMRKLGETNVQVYILIVLFAMSSWIDLCGVWVELPLLVNVLPEGWSLPSYLVIIIQIANIGPLAVILLQRCFPTKVKDWIAVYCIISVGALSCLLLVFFWDSTATIGLTGSVHSVGMLSLCASLALVDCTSSVVYLPYMASYNPHYMTALYVGEGLSGLVPGILGLVQGIGADPQCINTTMHSNESLYHVVIPVYPPPSFSIEVFFILLFLMLCISLVAFSILHFGPRFYTLRSRSDSSLHDPHRNGNSASRDVVNENSLTQQYTNNTNISGEHFEAGLMRDNSADDAICDEASSTPAHKPMAVAVIEQDMTRGHTLSNRACIWCFIVILWINAHLNGMLPSIQSFACLPYGSLAYTLSVRLSAVANPVACFVALFHSTTSFRVINLLVIIGSALLAYVFTLAAFSPLPPLQGTIAGEFLIVAASVVLTACFSYVKVAIATLLRERRGRQALTGCGVVTQLGSVCGAVLAFLLVNWLQLFQSQPPCQL